MQYTDLDAAIIGAGQAGLALGRQLQLNGTPFTIFDGAERVGDSWRGRYASLRLFSPRASSSLPHFLMPGAQDDYPTKDEVADYLENFARHYGIPVQLDRRVVSLRRDQSGFSLKFDNGTRHLARTVILCTGAFQLPIIPTMARFLDPELLQLTANTYSEPGQLPQGKTLVVGAGATGRQIALELSQTHETWLSQGRAATITPQRILGRDVMWWGKMAGLLEADKNSMIGRLLRRHDSFPGKHLTNSSLERAGVCVVGRTVSCSGRLFQFSCGRAEQFSAVVWAIGYRDDISWIKIAQAVKDTRIIEDRGVSPVPGLFYCGRSWQSCRASALLCGAAVDAKRIAALVRQTLGR